MDQWHRLVSIFYYARQVGVPAYIVVFINKADQLDGDEEMLVELVEMDIRDILFSEYEFPGDDIPVISGSALQALESIRRSRFLLKLNGIPSDLKTS